MNEQELRRDLADIATRARTEGDVVSRLERGLRRRRNRRHAITATGGLATVTALAVLGAQLLGSQPGSDPGFGGTPTPGVGTLEVTGVAVADGSVMPFYEVIDGELVMTSMLDPGRRPPPAPGSHQAPIPDLELRFPSFDGEGGYWVAMQVDGVTTSIRHGDDAGFREVLPLASTVGAIDYRHGPVWLTQGEDGILLQRAEGTEVVTVWRFPPHLGRGISPDDSLSVAWSADGGAILAVNTYVDTASERQEQMMIVVDPDGSPIVPARPGTHARWLDATRVLYKPYSPAGDDDAWRILDITTNEERSLSIEVADGTNPAISPDGTMLAIERADANLTVLFDLEAQRQLEALPGARPVWYDLDTLLVNEMEACSPPDCEMMSARATRRIEMIDVGRRGPERRFPFNGSTEHLAVAWAAPEDQL